MKNEASTSCTTLTPNYDGRAAHSCANSITFRCRKETSEALKSWKLRLMWRPVVCSQHHQVPGILRCFERPEHQYMIHSLERTK